MTRFAAMVTIISGACLMSFVGVLMRLINHASGFQILFYRSITMTLIVLLFVCLRRRCSIKSFLKSIDCDDLLIGAWLAVAFTCYIFSMINTSVASTLLILTIGPFIAAIIAWGWINEVPHPITWPTMIIAVSGVILMIYDGVALGYSIGNISALAAAICFAMMLVTARRCLKTDVLGGTFMACIFSLCLGAFAALILDGNLAISTSDIAIIFFMGACTIGLGIALVTTGTGYLPAAEVSLLVLTESVLGPIWPWVFLGEAMSKFEIIGGAITLAAVITLIIVSRTGSQDTRTLH